MIQLSEINFNSAVQYWHFADGAKRDGPVIKSNNNDFISKIRFRHAVGKISARGGYDGFDFLCTILNRQDTIGAGPDGVLRTEFGIKIKCDYSITRYANRSSAKEGKVTLLVINPTNPL